MNRPLMSFLTRKPDAADAGSDGGESISIDLEALGDKLEGLVSAAAEERAADEQDLRSTIQSLSESAAALERHVTVILDGTQASRAHLDDTIAVLRTELADAVTNLDARVNEHLAGGTAEIVYRVEETVRGIDERVGSVKARATELHEETAARLERIAAAAAALDIHIDSVANDVSMAAASVASSLEALRRVLTDTATRIEAQLRDAGDRTDRRVDALAETVAGFETHLEPIESAARDTTARVDRLGEQLERSNAALITTVAGMRRELAEDAAAAAHAADERIAAITAGIEALAARIDRLAELSTLGGAQMDSLAGMLNRLRAEAAADVEALRRSMSETATRTAAQIAEETTAGLHAMEERITRALAEPNQHVAELADRFERLGARFDDVAAGIDGSVRGHLAAVSQDVAARADEVRSDVAMHAADLHAAMASIGERADEVVESAQKRMATMAASHKAALSEEQERIAQLISAHAASMRESEARIERLVGIMREEMTEDRARFVAALEEAVSRASRRDRERVRRGFRFALRGKRDARAEHPAAQVAPPAPAASPPVPVAQPQLSPPSETPPAPAPPTVPAQIVPEPQAARPTRSAPRSNPRAASSTAKKPAPKKTAPAKPAAGKTAAKQRAPKPSAKAPAKRAPRARS